jgi:predicted PurR-regulated permease PerM
MISKSAEREEPVVAGEFTPWWHCAPGRAGLGALLVFTLAWAMRATRPVLLPLVLAILLAVVLSPAVRWLRRFRLPPPLAAACVVSAFTAAAGFAIYTIADPAIDWIERAPQTLHQVERRLRTVKASMLEARMAADTVEEMARVDGQAPPPEVTVKEPSLAARVVDVTRTALLQAAEVVILVYFLLAFGGAFLRRLLTLQGRLRARIRFVQMTDEIEREISNFLLTTTCINVGLGLATAAAMWLLQMPNPLLWGALAAVLNFVPYLGAFVTLIVLPGVAILTIDPLPRALLVPAIFLALATLEGQFITPMIVGRRMSLNPMVIAIALLAGGWIWGAVGLLLTVPLLAMTKIYCAHDDALSPIADLLGRD